MLCAGGGAEEASRTRVRSAWGKFNELSASADKNLFETREKVSSMLTCLQPECWYIASGLLA